MVTHAAQLFAEVQEYSSITTLVAAKYGISRRRFRPIKTNAYLLLKNDIEKGDINHRNFARIIMCLRKFNV